MQLTRHPLSALFSAYDLADDALQSMVDSIAEHGLLQPLTLHDGQILDGWNRYRACAVAGIEPRTVELTAGVDPWEFVRGINMVRRHMTPAERVAVLLRKREIEGGVPNGTADSVSAIRKEIEVGHGTAQRAAKVLAAADPRIGAALSAGKISLVKAAKVAAMPAPQRAAAIESPPEPRRTTKSEPEPEADPSALDDANERCRDLAMELEGYMIAAEGNEAAAKEISRLNGIIATLTSQRDSYMNERNELVRTIKSLQAKVKRMETTGKAELP